MSSHITDVAIETETVSRFTGTQINYYFVCKRKLWLFSHNIELESESDLVMLGRLLHEHGYKRKMKEVQVDRIKVDFMEHQRPEDPIKEKEPFAAQPTGLAWQRIGPMPRKEDGRIIIHEVKRSKKMQDAHLFQLLYYIYYLKHAYNVNVSEGVLHYPLIKQNVKVELTPEKEAQVEEAIKGITQVNKLPTPPEPVWKSYCKSCAFRELCWS
ncbi:MAG: CRISPR-associated protein Cas4 [Thaumarchaeota archaeon]|nr:CRISPR-associated protein Cas4 [Nitrososphaerota archaeon]